ncbi:YggT family protein [Litorimonas sp.]|uniref:YggT family protein n=1 Tax=Litorimonas sp. TaxID=1892381 RepID=UPI003A8BEA84
MSFLDSLIVFFISPVISILLIILFAYMIFSWLIAFNVVNLRNPVMGTIYGIISSIVEPILMPLRRVIPPLGGFDMAFLVLALGLYWINGWVLPSLMTIV